MVADQRGPEESIKINFFGRDLTVLTGPAILALKTGAPVLYGISVRQDDYSYKSVLTEISRDICRIPMKKKLRNLVNGICLTLKDYKKISGTVVVDA